MLYFLISLANMHMLIYFNEFATKQQKKNNKKYG